jgi:chemotaxis protein MotC
MSARSCLVLLASLFFLFGGAARAADAVETPLKMLADLQILQAKIAQGDKAAYAAQPAMLRDMGVAIADADPEIWKQPDNVHAAVAFLLSGGPPRAVASLLQAEGLAKEDEKLLRGALAYVVGREEEAKSLLSGFDVRTLDLRLAGQVAFVQSMLLSENNKKKAVELLDLARLLAPGGLVEEAALRREIWITAEMHDVDRFTLISCQYLNRFAKSVYADNLIRSIAQTVARLRLAEDLLELHKFDSLAASLPPDARRGFYLTISRAAMVDGKVDVADVAARLSLTQPYGEPMGETRGKFYGAASRLFGDQYDKSLAELNAIDVKKLPNRDLKLFAAVKDVAARVRATPPPPAELPAISPPANLAKDDEATMTTIRTAEATLARSESLTKGKRP